MAGGIVDWHFFDVESGTLPEEIAPTILPGGGEGRIVVLAATPFAQTDGWAARATVALAGNWAQKDLSVFLMDLGLESPSLHEALDLPNDEGVSDAFLYGASVQHIAKPALDDAIFFASAGTAAGDPAEVLGHPRWNDLAGGFSEADATLLLFLPTDVPGAEKILSRATDIVFLAAQGESADQHLGPSSIKVVAMAGPLGSPPEEIPEELEAPAPGGEEAAEDFQEEGAPEAALAPDGPSEEEASGGAEPEEADDVPDFDFGGGLELADDFGAMELEDEEVQEPGPEEGEEEDPLDFGGGMELLEEEETEDVHDLGIGADFSGGLEVEGTAIEEQEDMGGEEPPDFGADFVDFSDGEDDGGGFAPSGVVEDEGEFGGDLVQGPDFGGPAPDPEDQGWDMEEDQGPSQDEEDQARRDREEEAAKEEAPRPAPRRRPPPKKKAPIGRYVGVAVVLIALGAVGGTAFGFLNIPGLTVLQEYTGSIPEPALTLDGAQPTGPEIRYSLVLFDDYGEVDLGQAEEMMSALQDTRPDLLFYLVPEDVAGEVTFFLMAGPANNPLQAENLRGPLGEVLSREDPDSWEVRETPRAFYLGHWPTLEEARNFLGTVEGGAIDGYILQSTMDDGSEAFIVYSGAFQGVEDALRLQIILRRAGFLDAPLIERRGIFPG